MILLLSGYLVGVFNCKFDEISIVNENDVVWNLIS